MTNVKKKEKKPPSPRTQTSPNYKKAATIQKETGWVTFEYEGDEQHPARYEAISATEMIRGALKQLGVGRTRIHLNKDNNEKHASLTIRERRKNEM